MPEGRTGLGAGVDSAAEPSTGPVPNYGALASGEDTNRGKRLSDLVAAARARLSRPEPRAPARVRIGHLTYTVTVSTSDTSDLAQDVTQEGAECVGASDVTTQTIHLIEGLGPEFEAETLLHEVLHRCLRVSGCDPDDDAKAGVTDVEERTIKAITGPLLGALRTNRSLAAYLLGEETAS